MTIRQPEERTPEVGDRVLFHVLHAGAGSIGIVVGYYNYNHIYITRENDRNILNPEFYAISDLRPTELDDYDWEYKGEENDRLMAIRHYRAKMGWKTK